MRPLRRAAFRLLAAALVLAAAFSGAAVTVNPSPALALGTNYPWSGANTNNMSPLGFYYRQCTDYAAWTINIQKGGSTSDIRFKWADIQANGSGNAKDWRQGAINRGIAYNQTPEKGAVAWWGAGYGYGLGHVAVVSGVSNNGNTVTVDEYNHGVAYGFGWRTLHRGQAGWPEEFLHIADIPDNPPPPAPSFNYNTTVLVPNQDGTLTNFFVGHDDAIWYRRQAAPNSTTWSAATSMGGNAKSVSAALNADSKIQLVYVGYDNTLWYRTQLAQNGDTYSGDIGRGGWASSLTTVRNADGRLTTYYVGYDHAVWQRSETTAGSDNWGSDTSLNGWVKEISAGVETDGRIQLTFIGYDNAVWTRIQTTVNSTSFTADQSRGGNAKGIGTAAGQDGALESLFIGYDDALWRRRELSINGWWTSDVSLNGIAKEVTTARNADGTLLVVLIGYNNHLWHRTQTSGNATSYTPDTDYGEFAKAG